MNRIDETFARLKAEGRAALVTFTTAGDPDYAQSLAILNSLPEAGADIIELGMPFTDPMADGPAIQEANIRALTSGMTLKRTLDMVREFRVSHPQIPVILMGYFNPIHAYGTQRFAADAAEAGADGLIIVDLPPEEDPQLYEPARNAGLHMVRLITPVTKADRLETILTRANGFLYYVSVTGVTGMSPNGADGGADGPNRQVIANHIKEIRQSTKLPIAVGFGISTPNQAAAIGAFADAVVVGSAIVRTIGDIAQGRKNVDDVKAQVSALAAAIRGERGDRAASA